MLGLWGGSEGSLHTIFEPIHPNALYFFTYVYMLRELNENKGQPLIKRVYTA